MLCFSPNNIFQLLHVFIIFFAHRIVSNFVSNICINTVLSIILFHLFAYKCIYQIYDFVWFNLKFIVIITKSKNKKLNKNLFFTNIHWHFNHFDRIFLQQSIILDKENYQMCYFQVVESHKITFSLEWVIKMYLNFDDDDVDDDVKKIW